MINAIVVDIQRMKLKSWRMGSKCTNLRQQMTCKNFYTQPMYKQILMLSPMMRLAIDEHFLISAG